MSTLLPSGLAGRWSRWTRPLGQEQARRNAMTACTVLAARRLERLEVEEYVVSHLARHGAQQDHQDQPAGIEAPVAAG